MDQTKHKFKIQEAMEYYCIKLEMKEVISMDKVNLDTLFFAVKSLIGLRINPLEGTIARCLNDRTNTNNSTDEKRSGLINPQINCEHLNNLYLSFFSKFGKTNKPFGFSEEVIYDFKLVPKSESYSLKSIPYRKISERF